MSRLVFSPKKLDDTIETNVLKLTVKKKVSKLMKKKEKVELVKVILTNNVGVNTIVEFTNLSISEIEELRRVFLN